MVFGLAISLLLSACGLIMPTPNAQPFDPQVIYTQAAQTVIAQATLSAGHTAVVQLTQIAGTPTSAVVEPTQVSPPTATPIPTSTPLPTATLAPPTATFVPPTATQVPPTATRVPPTVVPIPCNRASFVKDVTIPDNTVISPGGYFVKTWRIKNNGSCNWTRDYALVFVSGNSMQGDRENYLDSKVAPGETIDLSVELWAPKDPGTYRGEWMLRTPSGAYFGIGDAAEKAFWVKIKVSEGAILPGPKDYAYDLAANTCRANWVSGPGDDPLPCPGNGGDANGSVIVLQRPEIETNRIEDELTIWTRPKQTKDGYIQGTFPRYKVKKGDRFLADVGCLADNPGCDVTFRLDYIQSNGKWVKVGSWHEVYDNHLTRIDIDLTPLEGTEIRFVLSVYNNGKVRQANAFWLVPSVRNNPGGGPDYDALRALAMDNARQRLAQDLGVDSKTISIKSVTGPSTWPDSCLGVKNNNQECRKGQYTGWVMRMTQSNKTYEVHTTLDGNVVYWFEA